MTVPVIKAAALDNPEHQFIVLSKSHLASYFNNLPSNISFWGVDFQQHKGVRGIVKLFFELKRAQFDAVADLHGVIRSIILRSMFCLSNVKVAHIDRGIKEKQSLVRSGASKHNPLKSTFLRYADVLHSLGIEFTLENPVINRNTACRDDKKAVGIAPFAAHQGKVYPIEKMCSVVKILAERPDIDIYLFGGGENEIRILKSWAEQHSNVHCIAGTMSRGDEVEFVKSLDVMLCMDSANMHIASLAGVPAISIWGATHPFAGFMGWGQSLDNVIQLDMPCRPCSIYGKKQCKFGDYRCLNQIEESVVAEKVLNALDIPSIK